MDKKAKAEEKRQRRNRKKQESESAKLAKSNDTTLEFYAEEGDAIPSPADPD